ncbi:hypothetical protein [Paraburkholderia aspalathi]|uniref:hypothetical protein n=1 Tax=Paraburkholderia aspalathi TaxID=1324617 RepID=UPI0038BBA8E4
MWAFAMIERLTYRYMKKLSSDSLDELMGGQSFTARTRLIRKLVDTLKGQDQTKAVVMTCLKTAEKLANTRNTLAHNPWQIWIDFDESKFKSAIKNVTNENAKLDLEQVRAFRDEAGELASTLEYQLAELRYPGP